MVLASILDKMTNAVYISYKSHLKPEWMPDELNERLNNQIEMEETEIIPEPLNQIVFRIVSILKSILWILGPVERVDYFFYFHGTMSRHPSLTHMLHMICVETSKAKMSANSSHTIQQRFILKNLYLRCLHSRPHISQLLEILKKNIKRLNLKLMDISVLLLPK